MLLDKAGGAPIFMLAACTPIIPPGFELQFGDEAEQMCEALPLIYRKQCLRCMSGDTGGCLEATHDADSGLYGPHQLVGRERVYMLTRGCLNRDSLACVQLSLAVKEGKGAVRNVERGDEMLDMACPRARRRCKRGDPGACVAWGLCAGHLDFDLDSTAVLTTACADDDKYSCAMLAKQAVDERTRNHALMKACVLRDRPACYELALRRQFGLGLQRDLNWSTSFYEEQCAAEPGGLACWALQGYIPSLSIVEGFVVDPDPLVFLKLQDTLPTQETAVVGHCFNESGAVEHVELLHGSGVPAADAAIIRVANNWRARPWLTALSLYDTDERPIRASAPTKLSVMLLLSGAFTDQTLQWVDTMAEREIVRRGAVLVKRSAQVVEKRTGVGLLKISVRPVDGGYLLNGFGPHSHSVPRKIPASHSRAALDAVVSTIGFLVSAGTDSLEGAPATPVPSRRVRCSASNLTFSTWKPAGTGPHQPPDTPEEIGPPEPGPPEPGPY